MSIARRLAGGVRIAITISAISKTVTIIIYRITTNLRNRRASRFFITTVYF